MNKGLEALDVLYRKYSNDDDFLEDDKLFATIEKELKALHIIKKYDLIDKIGLELNETIFPEEIKLVKEVLKNDNK